MPTPAYMTIMGERQGNITSGNFTEASVGNIYQEGHENETLIEAFTHQIMLPRDPQSGQPTGQRVHHPLKVTKVELKFYRTSAQGTMEHYYTMTLEDAIITDITAYMPNCQDPGQAHFTHLEDVQFTYRKLTKTYEVASTSESDDWRKPQAA